MLNSFSLAAFHNKRKAAKLKLFNYCYHNYCNTIYATENSECYAIEMKIHKEGYRALTIAITSLLISGYDYSLLL